VSIKSKQPQFEDVPSFDGDAHMHTIWFRILKCLQRYGRPCVNLAFLALFFSHIHSIKADDLGTRDLILFLKQATISPLDVEDFTARQHAVKEQIPRFLPKGLKLGPPIEFYEGAKSGSNFVLWAIRDPASPTNDTSTNFAMGRKGSKSYSINPGGIVYGIGSNDQTELSKHIFDRVSYFLNFGLWDLKPTTIVWTDDSFEGTTLLEKHVYGKLEVSNGLPRHIRLSVARAEPAYRDYEYIYPDPPSALSGYPSKIIISDLSKATVEPLEEITMLSIVFAQHPLPESFFDESKLIRGNIKYTNIYSNNMFFATKKDGTMSKQPLKMPSRLVASVHSPNISFWTLMILLAAGPCLIWAVSRKRRT
jgi:hypothetical protein